MRSKSGPIRSLWRYTAMMEHFDAEYYSSEYDIPNLFEEKILGILAKEIERYVVEGNENKTVYWSKIQDRNDVDIALKRTRSDSKDTASEAYIISDYEGLIVVTPEKKQNIDDFFNSIVNKLVGFKKGYTSLFSSYFSPGLIDILLMKGYLFVEDVLKDWESLCMEFILIGFREYSEEIENAKKYFRSYYDLRPAYVVFDEQIIQIIENESINTLPDLLKIVKKSKNDTLIEKISEISEYIKNEIIHLSY